jgi:hypothetical protein
MRAEDQVIITITREQAQHLIAVLHIEGYHEKREIPESLRDRRNGISKNMSRVLKKLRKGLESA